MNLSELKKINISSYIYIKYELKVKLKYWEFLEMLLF